MTPGIRHAKKAGIEFTLHQYDHDPNFPSYGEEAAEKLDLDRARVFKTLVAALDTGELVVAVVPVSAQLNLKALAGILGGKKAKMADKKAVERSTGYVLGGVSPLGQKKRLRTVIDRSALDHETIFVSGGRRGIDMELAPGDLGSMTNGVFKEIARHTP